MQAPEGQALDPEAPPEGQALAPDDTAAQETLESPTEVEGQALPEETAPEPEPLPSLGSEDQPLCLEPWRSLYILRRGTMPCCYGGAPVADFDEYREAWNGPEIVEIRRSLAAGEFPEYCLKSPACPIVRKHQAAGKLTRRQSTMLTARRAWFAFDRATSDGWRAALAWPVKKGVRFAVALRREPAATLRGLFGREER